MARPLVVTNNPVAVFPGSTASSPVPQTIYNTGTTIVYLGEDDAVQPYSGAPLRPGSTIMWDPDRSCYALTDPGNVGAVVILDNTGYLFDAGAIATQILDLGLAQSIADAIHISGAPPIDNVTRLQEVTTTTVAALPTIDTSTFQSIAVIVFDLDTTPPLPPVTRKWSLRWTRFDDGTPSAIEEFYGQDAGINADAGLTGVGSTIYRTSVKDTKLTVVPTANTSAGNTLIVTVIGSYKTVSKATYLNRSGDWGVGGAGVGSAADNFANLAATLTPGGTTTDYPPSKAGPAQLSVRSGTVLTAGTLTVSVVDINANALLAAVVIGPANGLNPTTVPIILPNRPIRLDVSASAALAPASVASRTALVFTN